MKNFIDNIFKPFIFPLILLILGALLNAGENLSSVTSFFAESSNKFLKFFDHQFYLWEIILYLSAILILSRVIRLIQGSRSSKEKLMLRTLERMPNEKPITINGTNYRFVFKYKARVSNEEYIIDKLHPYCHNCQELPVRMTSVGYGDFRCNCGKEINYDLCRDVESRIVSELEINEGRLR
ncbi:MAG: hypothetical protein NXI10_10410 [bacterium]|nr:hypothetical protein [bacterium]